MLLHVNTVNINDMVYITSYIITTIIFLTLDAIWLGRVAKSFYFLRLSHLIASKPNLKIAALFYACYTAGIVFFAIHPAMTDKCAITALINGAVFGFLAYGTYNFTNMATLKDWPNKVSLIDMIWGTALTAISACSGFWITTIVITPIL